MKLILDNTVLSNFASVGRLDLLQHALGTELACPLQVAAEFEAGVRKGKLPITQLDMITVIESLEQAEHTLFQEYCHRVNAGEAACLAIAAHRHWSLLSDDRDARKLAAQLSIPVSGTLGILLRLVNIGILTLEHADSLLGEMIAKGFRSPVDRLDDL
ncbi:MAG: DUF3368 domain-containing protein [Chloroflexota bacterium]|nr:DUF3368 domain-containing protein [Caldilinea sp.]GIK71445.1 MAG: DUF3368 domain-containing protein [Chloroflexota bacterium]